MIPLIYFFFFDRMTSGIFSFSSDEEDINLIFLNIFLSWGFPVCVRLDETVAMMCISYFSESTSFYENGKSVGLCDGVSFSSNLSFIKKRDGS